MPRSYRGSTSKRTKQLADRKRQRDLANPAGVTLTAGEAEADDSQLDIEDVIEEVNATEGATADAEEAGIDISKVKGTGTGGRVLKKDVASHKEGDEEE